MPCHYESRDLLNARAALLGVGITGEIENTGGDCGALKVERSVDLSFLYVTVEGEAHGQPLYVVGYFRDEQADGETISNAVDVHGLVWIVSAFRRGVVA